MLMNSQYDGYVFGQATSPLKRKQLVIMAKRGHPAARRIVRAQNQLHGFGDEDEQGSGIKTGDDLTQNQEGFDPNGWPATTDVESPPPSPPAPPPSGGSTTLNDIKGYGSQAVAAGKDAWATYNDIKNTVAPVAAQVGGQQAQVASTPAGNAGSANPQRIASAVQAFRVAVAAFISVPSAGTFNAAIAAWQTAQDAYADDTGNPPIGTATIIARIIAALNVAASKYEDMYNYWVQQNANKAGSGAGEGGLFVASKPAAARMATLTARDGAPSASAAAAIYATAGVSTTAPADTGSGVGTGTLVAIGVGLFMLLK